MARTLLGRALMRILPYLASLLVFVVACGSSSSDAATDSAATAPAPGSCTTAEDCNPDQCVCTDGEIVPTASVCLQNSCLVSANESYCASGCEKHGGVASIRPAPNVATSAECDAWCEKGASLACGSARCDRFFFCGVPKGSCEAATRAALRCAVEKGSWSCSTHSDRWSVGSTCPTFTELCE